MNQPTTPAISEVDRLGSSGPIEPSSALREVSRDLRHLYVALRMEGFADNQTLTMIGLMMAANRNQDPEQ